MSSSGRALSLLLVSAAVFLVACGGDKESWTYSIEDVIAAFDSAGYPLVERPFPRELPTRRKVRTWSGGAVARWWFS